MGSNTGVRRERQEVSSTDSPRVEGSSPVTGCFYLAEFICSNIVLASMPEYSTLGKPRLRTYGIYVTPYCSQHK